jgi:hypothetical protein
MAQISLTIKDTLYAKEVEAVAAMNGYTATIPDPTFVPTEEQPVAPQIPNITKEQFFKRQLKAWARNQAVEFANRTALAAVVMEAEEA